MSDFRDKFLLTRLIRDEKKVEIAFFILGLLVLFLLGQSLYITFLSLRKENKKETTFVISPSPSPVITSVIIPTNTPIPVGTNVIQQPLVKEYFISLGTGSNNTSDWADVPGVVAQLDFGSYTNIKEVHFEASVVIPTGNQAAYVRLFNVTDKHPVWYSEISLTNGQFISSKPMIYDIGQKTYQVQMKTDLQYMTNLIQSRLHIILQ